jgi:anti-sigma factor RsiW
MTLTEDILLRYADGQLDRDTAAAVAAALVHDDIAAERVRLIKLSGTALAMEAERGHTATDRDALARKFLPGPDVSDSAAHRVITPETARADSSWMSGPYAWRRQALAAGLLLAIGLSAGFAGSGRMQREVSAHPVWVMRIVDYHTLYGRSTVAGSTVTATETAQLEQRFSEALGRPVKIPAYTPAAMEFRRGQILEFERAPIIQLAYLPPREGTPMALCLTRGTGTDTQPSYERLHGIGMVRWRRAGLEYVLVGDQSEQDLRGYARQAIEQIATASKT